MLADLACAFPKQRIDRDTFRVYLGDLEDLPVDVLAAAVQDLRRTCDWFPTIKQIREQVAELALGLPGEAQALAQVEARNGWGVRKSGDLPLLHPLAKQALDLVGGAYAFKTTDEPGVVRGQFLRLYRDLRADAIRGAQLDSRALTASRPALPVS